MPRSTETPDLRHPQRDHDPRDGSSGPPADPGNSAEGHANADAHREGNLLFWITGENDFLAADQFYTTSFTALNGSGVTGQAIVGYDVDSNSITVAIRASGLEPNMVHVQHIHGFTDGTTEAQTPTLALHADGDGFIELGEGLNTYGPILLNLTTDHGNDSGSDNGHDHSGDLTGFPTAPDGNIWFVETYQLPAGSLGADPLLDLREIVIHGLTVSADDGAGTGGEVDGTAGYKLVLPVASGELEDAGSYRDFRDFLSDTGFGDPHPSMGDSHLFFG